MDELIGGLQSEWSIILAILILASVQIIKVIFDASKTRKEKIERDRVVKTLNQIDGYLRILSDRFTEEVTERQLPIIIREFMSHCKKTIHLMAAASITRNDVINNSKEIKAKTNQFIINHFKSMIVNFGLFKWKEMYLSDFLNDGWSNEISQGVIKIILRSNENKISAYRQLESFMDNKFDDYTTAILSNIYEI